MALVERNKKNGAAVVFDGQHEVNGIAGRAQKDSAA
jgi:hypothetical protein